MQEKIEKFFKLITGDRVDVSDALDNLGKEERMGGLIALYDKGIEDVKRA